MALSIEEYGWRQPIVVDEAGVIIAGHTRLRAAQKLGRETVPVHVAAGLSAAQVKGLRLMDNRSSEESGWDDALLVAELDELLGLDFDITYAGFEEDLEEVLASGDALGLAGHGADDGDEVPAAEAFPVSRLGDLWICGPHRVLCGNATLPDDVALLLGDEAAAMCFTDPPFNVAIGLDSNPRHRQRRGLVNDDLPDEDFAEFLARVAALLAGGGDRRRLLRHGRRRVAGARPRDARRRPAPLGDDHLGQGLLRARAQQVPPPLRADLVRLARERDQLATPPAATRTTSGSSRAPSAARSTRR